MNANNTKPKFMNPDNWSNIWYHKWIDENGKEIENLSGSVNGVHLTIVSKLCRLM